MERTEDRQDIGIRPVARTRAHEEVARQLEDLMQRGTLLAGDRLPSERELAQRFQVSRATVRQALSVLQASGLVESRIGNGTFARTQPAAMNVTSLAAVLRLAQGTLNEQLELRRLVEPQVASLAAERADDSDLEDLGRYIELQEARLAEGVPFVDEDSGFHLAIARAAKNTLLVKMIEGIHELLKESRENSLRAPGGMPHSLAGHRRLYEAISSRDGQAAYDAMHSHIVDVERLSLQRLAERESDRAR